MVIRSLQCGFHYSFFVPTQCFGKWLSDHKYEHLKRLMSLAKLRELIAWRIEVSYPDSLSYMLFYGLINQRAGQYLNCKNLVAKYTSLHVRGFYNMVRGQQSQLLDSHFHLTGVKRNKSVVP